jgi:hypothetical protein
MVAGYVITFSTQYIATRFRYGAGTRVGNDAAPGLVTMPCHAMPCATLPLPPLPTPMAVVTEPRAYYHTHPIE